MTSTPVAIDVVPGLSVCTEFFSTDVERSLYYDPLLFDTSPAEITRHIQEHNKTVQEHNKTIKKGSGGQKMDLRHRWMKPMHAFQSPHALPKLLIQVCNGIPESGLCPEFIAPDYCLPISYPAPIGQFFYHYDSRYRWGETVVGITLGTGGIMSFQPQTKKAKNNGNGPPFVGKRTLNNQGLVVDIRQAAGGKSFIVDVYLPPRSIYVMTGDSRTDWKHMVQVNNEQNRQAVMINNSIKTNPALSDCVMRRTITLRSTKVFSDEVLARLLRSDTNNKNIEARFKAQSKWRPQGGYGNGEIDDAELLNLRQQAVRDCNMVQQTFQNVFLSDRERGYVRRFPGKSCWPLKGINGANQASSLVDDLIKKMNGSLSTVSSSTSSSPPTSSPPTSSRRQVVVPQLNDLRAKRCAFFEQGKNNGGTGASSAAAAASSASSAIVLTGSKQKKRKQPPTASAAASSAAMAIDLLGDSSSDEDVEDSKPAASKKKTTTTTTPKGNNKVNEIIEID